MKKIILVFIAVTIQSFAQSLLLHGVMPTDQNYRSVSVLYTYNAADSTYNAVPGTTFSLSSTSFTSGSYGYASKVDTLSDVSDTLLFNFGKQFTTQKFKVYSASGDTLALQVYSDGLDKWSSAGTGVYKSWNGSIVASNSIVIPAATTAVFYINDTHIGNIRFLWYYGLDKTDRTMPIEFIGENK